MENIPVYIALFFGITTAATVLIFYKAAHHSNRALFIILGWLLLQSLISGMAFYSADTSTLPPRFLLLVGPPLLLIISLFVFKSGQRFIDSLDIKRLTLLHIIRVPVELVLLFLFINKGIPKIMTFEGQNFDILSGLTSGIVYYLVFVRQKTGKMVLLVWNFICLGLLINIVTIAVLATPYPFQQLSFDQPNVAVLYFPYVWLPACVVPLVLLSHLASIRILFKEVKVKRFAIEGIQV